MCKNRTIERVRERAWNSITDGLIFLNSDGVIEDANPAAREMIGFENHKFEGVDVFHDRI
jgi:PAS domain S-box-containing protein